MRRRSSQQPSEWSADAFLLTLLSLLVTRPASQGLLDIPKWVGDDCAARATVTAASRSRAATASSATGMRSTRES
ncbi:MAG: hypothetical protein JWR58_5166 [Pseudonocardia sp.]|nr:hypothetical protein [Pseudonocardia sp.]